jgi:signal transduction histidine kinase
VSVIVDLHGEELRAIVEDNGNGFEGPPPSHAGRGGLGLRGMAERAALAGGRMELESSPDTGTTLYLTLPLSAAAGAAPH